MQNSDAEVNLPIDDLAKEIFKLLDGKSHSLANAVLDYCKDNLSIISVVSYP